MTDPVQNALDQLLAYGLDVGDFVVDGRLHRCKAEGDKGSKKSGWYVAHEFALDSGRTVITGKFGNWKVSSEPQAFAFDAKWTESDRAAFREQQEKQRRAAAKEKRERNRQAAAKAERIWPGLPSEGASDYLARKRIHGFGCRYSRGAIVVPMYKAEQLVGLQFIYADGTKRFLTGTEKEGASFKIDGAGDLAVCEGYSTACSIHMATGRPVVVVFDAGNLAPVVQPLADGGAPILIAADNDHQLAVRRPEIGNAGLKAARKLADRFDAVSVVWPEFEPDDPGSDFNDLHVARGLEAVRAAVEQSGPQVFPADTASENVDPADFAPPEPAAIDDSDGDEAWTKALQRNDRGKLLPLSSNVAQILEHHAAWRGALSYCEFSYRLIKRREILPDMGAGEWEDADAARLAIWLSNTFRCEPPRNKLADGLITVAQRARFHPVREYLEALEWDGTPRLDHWIADVYEASGDSAYLAAVGRFFLVGAVARIMAPGCKMDYVMILEGRQGLRKSTSMAVLFGEWFSDAPIPIGDKDAYQNIQGVWCSELAELDSFNKAESTSAKLFFSQRRDRYRPSYGHCAQDFPRQTIFVGTTNQSEYLKDYTGNRRYWPVKCNLVNLELLEQNRDQYWAEALQAYRDGAVWWPDDTTREAFEAEQDLRMQIDPWQYKIEDYLNWTTAEYVTSATVLIDGLERDAAAITRADQNRIGPIMKALGWKNVKKRVKVGTGDKTVPRHVYIRGDTDGE